MSTQKQTFPENPNIEIKSAGGSRLFTNYIFKAIPLAFDESMSYYETLCGLLDYLKNTIIPVVNNNADAVAELQKLYIELHNYVENYFDNLDVQEEINNKLDKMVEDGTFDKILNEKLLSEINEKLNSSIVMKYNVNDNTSINKKFKRFELFSEYYDENFYYTLKIDKNNIINAVPTSGNPIQPNENPKSLLDLSEENTYYDFYFTGGLFNTETYVPRGFCKFNGTEFNVDVDTPSYYVGFDKNNNLIYKPSSEVSTIDDLAEFNDCVGTWAPIIINGQPFDFSSFPEAEATCRSLNPRQIVYEDNDGYIYFTCITGRNNYQKGVNYDGIVKWLANKNIKTCLNLDGGGSVEGVYNKKFIFQTLDPRYKKGRIISNGFGIKIKGDDEL